MKNVSDPGHLPLLPASNTSVAFWYLRVTLKILPLTLRLHEIWALLVSSPTMSPVLATSFCLGTLHMLSLPPGMPFSFHHTRWLAPSSQLLTSLRSQFTCFSNFPPTYTPSPAWVTHCQCLQCLSPDSTVSTMRAGSCLFCLSFCSQYLACASVYLAGAWNTVGTQ